MRPRHAVLVAGAVLVGSVAASWVAGWGPFHSAIDADERAVVEQVEAGDLATRPADAARYIDTNIAALLSSDVASAVDGPDLGRLFEAALENDDKTLDIVVAGVAQEAQIHNAELRLVLGEAVTTRMAWFDAQINAPFSSGPGETSDQARRNYLAAHDFLRETMQDPHVAARLRRAVNDYGQAEVANAPDEGRDRAHRLADLGRIQAFFTQAQDNAEMGDARNVGDAEAIEAANAADRNRKAEDVVDSAVWLALDRFGARDASADQEVQAAAAGEPFVDDNGELNTNRRDSEEQAFRDWALRQTLEGGLTEADGDAIDAGAASVLRGGQAPALTDRR